MSSIFRDRGRSIGDSKRHNYIPMPIYPIESLPSPFGDPAPNLSDAELRETAYEILIGFCRTSASRPLTYISQPERAEKTAVPVGGISLQRSFSSSAASKVKKALGMKSASTKKRSGGDSVNQGQGQGGARKMRTVGELVKVQMRVSEQMDSRVRRALSRIASVQVGKSLEAIVLPLELLQQLKSSDFPSLQEYEAWQRRNLKLLEAGLLLHPHLPLDERDSAPGKLKQIIHGALERPMETGKHNASMRALRDVVLSLACRSSKGAASEMCHWADGIPFNLRVYQMLLEACFDVSEETIVIEEVDEVLELIKKTWVILGLNQMLHNLCFLWVLFHRYVSTGLVESELLFAANSLMEEVEKDAKETKDPVYAKILSSILSSILDWAEKRLRAYRDSFHGDNIELMKNVISLAVLAAKTLAEADEYHRNRKDVDVARSKIDSYIRSSLRTAFSQEMEKLNSSRKSSKKQQNPPPLLSILAEEVSKMAFSEKAMFSPIMKRWHTLASGVAVATLHSCYRNELKQFVSAVTELTPDSIQVLRAADELEKDLVQIAVEDAVDSEDGGKSIIQEMPPYEAEALIANLVESWITTRVDRLKEWVDRNLQQEVWNPLANKQRFAPSAVEVLRTVDETLEAFFLLPIPMHTVLLPELLMGLDRCLQNYILKTKSGCGSRDTFIPNLPALTRCSTGSKFHGVFRKKDKSHVTRRRKSQAGTTKSNGDSFGIPQLCVRINTLQHIRMQLDIFEKRTIAQLRNSESTRVDEIANGLGKRFELSVAACVEGIQELSEATAYKVVFQNLSHVLWDGLYVGDVPSSRIEPFLQELEQYLEIISSTVHDRVRTLVITDIMKASVDGFLLVLLAGGPSRSFVLQDSEILVEDFKFLTDLFWSNGDGLPADIIDKLSSTVESILPLCQTDSESIIERYKCMILENNGSASKSKLQLPPTSGHWNPTEPNTLLRVLCHRRDEAAAKFLKKTYNLPKRL